MIINYLISLNNNYIFMIQYNILLLFYIIIVNNKYKIYLIIIKKKKTITIEKYNKM